MIEIETDEYMYVCPECGESNYKTKYSGLRSMNVKRTCLSCLYSEEFGKKQFLLIKKENLDEYKNNIINKELNNEDYSSEDEEIPEEIKFMMKYL